MEFGAGLSKTVCQMGVVFERGLKTVQFGSASGAEMTHTAALKISLSCPKKQFCFFMQL